MKAKASCDGWPSDGWTVTDYPSVEECGETIACEIPVPDSSGAFDEAYLEYLASKHIADLGWRAYSHPGGMRYAPQWYCPHHAALIRDEPDALEPDRRPGQLKNHLWPA